jgi:ABC-type transport system involved in multi-copper enzyme maturation permease subunit
MQLLKFELYKIFKEKSIYIAFVLLLIMSYLSLGYPFNAVLEKQMYKDWEGTITEEKVQRAKSEYAQLTKKEKEREDEEGQAHPEEIAKMWMLQKIVMSQGIEENLKERLSKIENEVNLKARMEKKMLEKIDVSNLTYHSGPAHIVSFVEFGSFIVLGVMLMIGLSQMYSKEYSSGVDNYIFSSKKGRKELAIAKICASLIFTLVVVFAWEVFNLAANFIMHGSEGWGTPIQLITLYSKMPYVNSPYAFTMLEYHFIQLGIHILGAFAFALLIVLISSINKSSLASFIISAFIFFAPLFLVGVEWFRIISPFYFTNVLRVQFLFDEFKTVDIFGYPILYPVLACIIMVVLSLIFIRSILYITKHKQVTS